MRDLRQPTRRTFLRVLGSALVGAAVVPALPARSPLTYEQLERAYHAALESGPPPGLLPVRSMARRQTLGRKTGLLYDVDLAA